MFICIAGNINAREVIKKIESSVVDRGEVNIERAGFDEPERINKSYVEQSFPVLTPIFCFGFKQKIASPYRRLKSKICVELLLEIICGEASPLYKRLMEQGLINDEFDYEYFNGRDYAAVITVYGDIPESVAALREAEKETPDGTAWLIPAEKADELEKALEDAEAYEWLTGNEEASSWLLVRTAEN